MTKEKYNSDVASQPFDTSVVFSNLSQFLQFRIGAMECTCCHRKAPRSASGESKTYMLLCGDVLCPACLAEQARVSLHVPNAVPVRCCRRNIRTEWIAEVLEPPELIYYNFLLSKRLQRDPRPAGATSMKPGKTTTVVIDEGDESDEVILVERASAPAAVGALGAMTRSKAAKAKAKSELVVDLQDEISEEDTNSAGSLICFSCKEAVPQERSRIQAPCSHYLCVKCVKSRCIRALENEKEGSIGMPILCCKQIVPLEVVLSALTRRQSENYKLLYAKRKDLVKHVKCGRATGKRKAAPVAVVPVRQSPAKKRAKTQALDVDDAAEDERSKQQQRQDVDDETDAAGECVACLSDITDPKDQFRGPCGHLYCAQCLTVMAKQSLEDRSLVPIRCCATEFPLDYVAKVLPIRSMATYKRFLNEKDWRSSNLKSDQDYAKLVKKVRGKQCPTCGIGVQKISGCNSITCLRGHRFCWACGLANCSCYAGAAARIGLANQL